MMKKIIESNKKILLGLIASVIFSYLFLGGEVYAVESYVEIEMDGQGTERYPYLISDVEDLDNLRDVINSGNDLIGKWFALTNDIDVGGVNIEPLVDQTKGMTFHGGFDGRGFKISNFIIDGGREGASFFGRLDGVVENLELDGTFKGNKSSSFAQNGYGLILNCISSSNIFADEVGAGIVNNWNGMIQNVVFQGKINAKKIDGIVNLGNGIAKQVYAKEYEIGNIETVEYGNILEENISDIIDELNLSARQMFFSLEYGKWLNKWAWGQGRFKFSDEIVAFKGTGSENDPYIIDSIDKLVFLMEAINAGCTFDNVFFYQTEDIDLSEHLWEYQTLDAAIFSGIYDGNGHIISNLNNGEGSAGLFRYFNGKILNLQLINCNAMQSCGFAESMGSDSLIYNSYCDGEVGGTVHLRYLQEAGQLVNCYIEGFVEPTIDELNAGLNNLVTNYGVHCGELYTWLLTEDGISFGNNFKSKYFEKERLYWKGCGTENNPYLIASLEDFVYLRESVFYNESFWRYWFLQTEDIDFANVRFWRAIASESSMNSFYGYYDGDGYEMLNFHHGGESDRQDGTIFGNLRGSIMNVHVKNYQFSNGGNGILAYNVYNTGKIFNNIIEINDSVNIASAVGVVYKNDGRVINNIVVCPEESICITVALKNNEANINKKIKNHIVNKLDTEIVELFNEGVLETALHIKQRITNFNILLENNNTFSLQNNINYKSLIGMKFIKRMALSNPLLLVAILWTGAVSIFILIKTFTNIYIKKRIRTRYLFQTIILILVYFAFVFAMFKLRPDILMTKLILYFNIVLLIILGICTVSVICRWKDKEIQIDLRKINFKENLPIGIALLITTIVVVFHLNTPVAYDADLYYGSFQQAIQNFRFSVGGFLDSFCIASKPMHGIAMLMAIGEAIDPGTARGIYVCNLILLLLAQLCMYHIIRKLFPQFSLGIDASLSMCFVFAGYVIAGATYINPDFYSVVSFVIFLCCILYDYKLFTIFSGFLVICSKPNMIIAYAIFGLVWFIYECITKELKIFKWLAYTISASSYVILYFGINSLNRVGIAADSNNEIIYTLGSRLLQYFAYGFIWVQEIFIIFALIVLIYKKRILDLKNKKAVFIISVWFACFSQLIITIVGGGTLQLCPRYLAVCAIKNTILFAMALEVLELEQLKVKVIVNVLAITLFVQLFVTIDPFIIVTTDVKFDSLHYLVFPKTNQNGNDLTFYNYEYCKDARDGSAILETLSKEEINNLYSDSRTGYKMAIGSSSIYAAYWDMVKKCRTYVPNNDCVRLQMKSIVDGMNVKEEDFLKDYAVVLRKSKEYTISSKLSEIKESKEIGNFIVYYANN